MAFIIILAKLADDDVIEVIEGVETKLQCVASASKPRTEVDWIFQGISLLHKIAFFGNLR